jgi:protein O-GlcNAc transferase
MVTIDEALAMAVSHHQAGQFAEAERLYRQVLSVSPNHPHALHLLGMLALGARQFPAAVELIQKAIQVDRTQAAFHANLGEAYRQLGALDEAAASFRAALAIDASLGSTHAQLGRVLAAQGAVDAALAEFRESLRLRPDDSYTRRQLGDLLCDAGQLAEAEICFRRVTREQPESADVAMRLADVLQSQHKLVESIEHYKRAIALDAKLANAHNNLGLALSAQGEGERAIEAFRRAISIEPRHTAALTNLGLNYDLTDHPKEAEQTYLLACDTDPAAVAPRYNLGVLLARIGEPDRALRALDEVLRLDPKHAAAHMALSQLYQAQEEFAKAIESCHRAVELEPQNAQALNNLGAALSDRGKRDEAIACFDRALALDPQLALAHGNRAVSLQSLGRLDEAIAEHRRAVELDPTSSGLHSNLLYALHYSLQYDGPAIFNEHLAWAKRHAEPLTAAASPHDNERSTARRLRVGYVSPHFMSHAVDFFVQPILEHHDRERIELYCYSDVGRGDAITQQLRGVVPNWRDTAQLANARLAELVRQDKIDILVDLTGHISGGKRMLLFAERPAPVQVTYIGYQNTTGMTAMNYRLTDAYSDPPGQTDPFYTERLVRLPQTFFCYQPSADAPAIVESPLDTNGQVTFGSFNNFSKVTDEVLAAWAKILKQTPKSRLVILADMAPSLRKRLGDSFAGAGISAERLELVDRVPRERYLQLINRVDIALDPFPFNGHTTTCDCLWQGVPVVTLSGDRYVSRFGGSGLITLGLHALVTDSPADYIACAQQLAQDPDRLRQLRRELRQRMSASPLLDFKGFTRNLEAEYDRMWAAWVAEN